MTITILTLFPDMFRGPFDQSIVNRAKLNHAVEINLVQIRDYADDSYKSVDDHPYGGGIGMVMRVDVIDKALSKVKCQKSNVKCKERIILLDPRGTPFIQAKARELTKFDHLILICGHYEGVDERVTSLVDESVSIGEYILTGGEIPAMAVTDAVVRLLPNVLKKEATSSESFSLHTPPFSILHSPVLEYPQYTRPEQYKGMKVPEVLLGGNHKNIEAWRRDHATVRTDRASRRRKTA